MQVQSGVTISATGTGVINATTLQGTAISGTTGTGNAVLSISPVLTGTVTLPTVTLSGTQTVGTGASIVVSGSGVVQATQIQGVTISVTAPSIAGQVLTSTSTTAANWQTPAGSTTAGDNVVMAWYRDTSLTDSVSGFSVMIPLLAGNILSFANTWKASLIWTTANVIIAGAVVYKAAVNDSTFTIVSATPVTFNGGASYPYTYGTAGGELFTDAVSLSLDDNHDYYLVLACTSGTLVVGHGDSVPQWQQSNRGCGYLSGNQTTLTTGGTVPNFPGSESDWFRVVRLT